MPLVKIGPKHQITIPKEVFKTLQLEAGDILEITVRNGKGVMIPKHITERAPAPKLSTKEQQILKTAKKKIEAIQNNLKIARGLTHAEIEVAVKVSLIDPSQKWWWREEWQQGERAAQKDIDRGQIDEFENVDDFIRSLRS